MDCEHGWRNAADCDACTRARVMPSAEARIAELEAALHKINALIDSPARFNPEVQAVLDSVIDTNDVKFANQQ